MRALLDTAVFVDVLRERRAADSILAQRWVIVLSAVVYSELLRGARSRVENNYLTQLARSHAPVAPTADQWARCGALQARLRREEDFDASGLRRVQNDLLIALTARDLGCLLVTPNGRDFERLSSYLRGVRVTRWPV